VDLLPSTIADAIIRKASWPNLLALALLFLSAAISALLMYRRAAGEAGSLRGFVRFAFPLEILLHPSARADVLFWTTRKAMMWLLMMPVTISSVATVGYLSHGAFALLLEPGPPRPAGPITIVIFTVTMLLVYDLSYYFYHRMQHAFPTLWELHKVHHSAEVMIGITKDRVHPVDEIMNRLWDGLLPGIAFGVWSFFVLDPVELTIFGVNVYVMRGILMMDLIRHTHLKISFGRWMNQIILCPHYHQLHHSTDPRHYDKNFGLMMPLWDRLFGTLAVPAENEGFTFGLADRERVEYRSMSALYILPLRKMGRHLARHLRGIVSTLRPPSPAFTPARRGCHEQ
jgi:sterol desaturase/sphingolipid hydroxylase (fatty acid hydroxylase superfamily)